MNKKLFLSAVSSEFEAYRKLLAGDLKRPTLDVAVQEDFIVTDGTTLQKLDTYIRVCDGVVHLIGKAAGAIPEPVAVQKLLIMYPDLPNKLPALAVALSQPDPGFSYTQWEAYLAIYHNRPIFVYRPTDFDLAICECPREDRFEQNPDQEMSQREHYSRISALGRDRGQFLNPERLSSAVLRDLVDILPALERRIDVPPTRLTHTAEKLVGRERELTVLDEAWNNLQINLIVVRGKGGEGKTSLVATWMAELAFKDWRGAEQVIDWSFYSQGTRDQTSATAEFFVNQALTDLGDPDPNAGGAEERAARLAKLINEKRTLLVLDGLEPLQYPPGAMHGALKDAGMAALLRGLVARNSGLVVVTTREKVTEIQQHYGRSAIDHDLTYLSPLAGAQLLHYAGATCAGAANIEPDDHELQQTSEEVRGHALTLFLIGQYLRLTEKGNIRKRDTMNLADAEHEYSNDATRPYGHAFKAIEAYEKWFAGGDQRAQLQLSVLRLLGLFDRPASAGCLESLRTAEITGLTDVWKERSDKDWRMALARLQEINLIEVSDDGTVDCHPLIREYFAVQLRKTMPRAFVAAHSQLFDFLCESTEHQPDTLADLLPLYQAVTHGCLAERHQEACAKVYRDRIQRGSKAFSKTELGAVGADLGAVVAFFEEPWRQMASNLSEPAKAWLLNEAATRLRALGRLTEAVEPMRIVTEMTAKLGDWKNASVDAGNLSELELTLGDLDAAVSDGRRSTIYADRSEDAFWRMAARTTAADALYQQGERDEACELFTVAEEMQQGWQPQFPLLYSVQGFQYVDLILSPAERAAWQWLSDRQGASCQYIGTNETSTPEEPAASALPLTSKPVANAVQLINKPAIDACHEATRRAKQTLEWATKSNSGLLTIALDHLTLARASLYRAILESHHNPTYQRGTSSSLTSASDLVKQHELPDSSDVLSDQHPIAGAPSITENADFIEATKQLVLALSGLRNAGTMHHIPKGLLTAAMLESLRGDSGITQALAHLDEAQQIATRGPMPLYLADVHLTRARIIAYYLAEASSRSTDPTASNAAGSRSHEIPGHDISPVAELAEARRLIEKHKYGRRIEELEDAEKAILHNQ